jgi:phospholipase/carboxylesterase
MASIIPLSGPVAEPASGRRASQLVVLLHGLGADGDDLLGLAAMAGEALPDAAFVAPDAPFPCDLAPMGRQWFSLADWSPASVAAGVRQAAPSLDAFLDAQLAERRLPASALALIGFSQGTMMALHVALRRADPVAGMVGFSGVLVDPDSLAGEIRSRPPVLLVHGDSDPVVDCGFMGRAQTALAAAGVPVSTMLRPGLAHSIDEAGLTRALAFLREGFGLD